MRRLGGRERSVRSAKLNKEYTMKKDTWTPGDGSLTEMAAKCADRILLHSKDRMRQVKGAFEPVHKAYMSLAMAASKAVKAFAALDESLK